MEKQGLGAHPALLNNPNLREDPLLLLSGAPLSWENFQVTREVRQHHVVRLVCGGEDTADGASADMNGTDEPGRTSFSPGGAGGWWSGDTGWGTAGCVSPARQDS